MKKLLALLSLAVACGAASAADPAKDRIEADYKAAKAQCGKLEDRKERKVCEKDAKGHRKVALAQLESDPKHGDWQKVDRARQAAIASDTDAQYAAEKGRCNQLPKDRKEHCVADAKKKFSKG
jgi:Ni/Co efflux regulator RcnB